MISLTSLEAPNITGPSGNTIVELILGFLISCHLLISSTEANSRLICLGSDIPANWKCLSSIPGMAAMSSYSTSARLVIYMGRPNEISHSSILPKLPRGSLANFNSDTLQGTCGNHKQTNDTRKKEEFFFSNNSLSHACLSSYEFFSPTWIPGTEISHFTTDILYLFHWFLNFEQSLLLG